MNNIRFQAKSVIVLLSFVVAACSLPYQKEYVRTSDKIMIGHKAAKTSENAALYASYLSGLHAQYDSDFGRAADYFSNVVDVVPDNNDMLDLMQLLLASEGRIDEAAVYSQKILDKKINSGIASSVLIASLAKDKKYTDAIKISDKLDSALYSQFFAPMMKGWLYVGEKKYDLAFKEFEKLKSKKSLASLYFFHSGMLHDYLGNVDKAKKSYEQLMESNKSLSLSAVEVVGSFFVRNNDEKTAEGILQKYRENNASSVIIDSISIAKLKDKKLTDDNIVNYGLAETMFGIAATFNSGFGADVSQIFSRLALYLDKDYALARMLIGEILEARDLYEDANKLYDEVEPNDVTYFAVQLKKASNYTDMKQTKKAIKQLKKLADIRPDYYVVYSDLGDAYRVDEKYKDAIKYYQKALDSIKEKSSSHWVIYYSQGICYDLSGQWEKAETAMLEALKLMPNQPDVLNYLAYSWLDKSGTDKKRALAMLYKAYHQRPDDPYISDSLGWAYYRIGEYRKSLPYVEKAVENAPANAVLNDHLGDIYWQLGRKKEAVFQWNRALVSKESPLKPKEVEATNHKIKYGLEE